MTVCSEAIIHMFSAAALIDVLMSIELKVGQERDNWIGIV